MALDIKRELAAVDLKNYEFYDKLTEKEQKEFSPYVLMRYVSNVDGSREFHEWFIDRTNELINKDHWLLSKDHKALLWKLYAGVGIGQKVYHPYLKACSKEPTVKIEKLLAELHPAMKISDVKLMASLMTPEDKTALFDSLGFDKKQRKEYQ